MFELYQKLSQQTTPTNFTALQAARTINDIDDNHIKETILLLIFHYYLNDNKTTDLYTVTGQNKINLPYNGHGQGTKSASFNFSQFPNELQNILINYLWECAR